jgi:putative hemin transport protein
MTTQVSWSEYRKQNRKVRIRDAAQQLGIAESQLLATECGRSVTRLRPDWKTLMPALTTLGRVKTVTRNEQVVLERVGRFEKVEIGGHGGQVVGEIDLRLFLHHWGSLFAVADAARDRYLQSLQIFDASGQAVHKIYLEPDSDEGAYHTLVEGLRHHDQSQREEVVAPPPRTLERADQLIEVALLQSAWDAMQDTHEFFGLLRQFGVTRTQALRLAGATRAQPISPSAARTLLHRASERALEIMIFVGNPGVIQIYTGPVGPPVTLGGWLNILDAAFNLHLREEAIASAWIVRKPTRDGLVTSLELFDAAGETLALFFGKRKPGQVESEAWRAALAELDGGVA